MRKTYIGRRLAGLCVSCLVSSVFATLIMAGPAYARPTTDSTALFSPASLTRQDQSGGDRTPDINKLPSGFTTLTAGRSLVFTQDPHIVTLSAAFLADATYAVPYYVMVRSGNAGMLQDAGLIRHPDGVAIATVHPNVPFSLPATPVLTTLMAVDNATDIAKTGANSETSEVSKSFLAQLPVPELGTMELISTGILVLTEAVRRRNS